MGRVSKGKPKVLQKPNDLDPGSVRHKWRKRRMVIVEQLLRSVIAARGRASIIDVGGTARYWNLLDPGIAPYCTVTLVNLPEWLNANKLGTCSNGIEFVKHAGDGCNLADFSDAQFDLSHSNSVIEHVGSLERMASFAHELRRVGRSYFCQTPYLWFPIEPHYGVPLLHWLPGPTRARLAHRFAIGWRQRYESYEAALKGADHTQLLDQFMFRKLFPDATVRRERTFLVTKSLMAVRNELPLAPDQA